ncbi:DUF6519 domain-containing protein [Mesorhizobium sp. IMUNJ 23232]|uniref:DUF6519 domain-containing protein n=1 Tax=Mesorhizobium sp. IMUNJ 23232 TaxID=3376064 RepID=UPI00378C8184
MSAIDITRNLHQPAKHYSGLVQLQGSVILDAELNERDRLQDHAMRRLLTDFVCSRASPDDGFKIDAVTDAPYDFTIKSGSLYLGGMRFDMEHDETFLLQSDWLQQGAPLPTAPTDADLAAGSRFDAVFGEGHEQPVSGSEDGEIVEAALGGPQPSARMRRMRRVRVLTATPDNCPDAFDAVLASLGGTFNRQSCELVSNRRLSVGFQPLNIPPDPCSPRNKSGYLGAENETIQVRVIAPGRFVWSFGNASPVYKVKLIRNVAAGRDAVEIFPPPRDQSLRPRAGDIIELIRCGSLLSNGELAAEHHGLMTVATTAYDPQTRRVEIATPSQPGTQVPAAFSNHARTQALAALLAPELPADFQLQPEYYYARVWRGQAVPSADHGIAFVNGTAVALGNTGVTVTFTGDGPVGDFWTFSVRPHTPDIIVPWEMRIANGVPPTGLKRYVAPLALIEWFLDDNGAVRSRVHDCRRTVRKLCESDGCCEITVGDGTESHGDVDSLAAAIDLLPANGGKICLLRGHHDGHVVLKELRNVTIEGCGPLSILHGLPGRKRAVIGIFDCDTIRLRNFVIDAPETIGLHMADSHSGKGFGRALRSISVKDMGFIGRDRPCVIFDGGDGLTLEGCRLRLDALQERLGENASENGLASAVIVIGAHILIERNAIAAGDKIENRLRALGGIHVLGGSEDVDIRRNAINGGSGTGIQLGSISLVKRDLGKGFSTRFDGYLAAEARKERDRYMMWMRRIIVEEDGCIKFPPDPHDPGDDDPNDPRKPDADLAILRLRIIENDIASMGGDGIGVFAFFDICKDPQFISISDAVIRGNRITGCALREAPKLQDGLYAWSARGGIVLAHAEKLVVEDNQIIDCGADGWGPICGFFCAMTEGVRFEGNLIVGNGRRIHSSKDQVELGQRGGIVIRYAMPPTTPIADMLNSYGKRYKTEYMRSGTDAVLIANNRISAPEGRALDITGLGGMSISGNQLESLGAVSMNWVAAAGLALASRLQPQLPAGAVDIMRSNPLGALFGGAVVFVMNLCALGDHSPPGIGLAFGVDVDSSGDSDGAIYLSNGKVMFNDNQTHYEALTIDIESMVFSGIFLGSLDDVQMCNNQGDVDLARGVMCTHAAVLGPTVNVQHNRLSEPFSPFLDASRRKVYLSLVTFGTANITTMNFGTHCILPMAGNAQMSIVDPNRSYALAMDDKLCDQGKRTVVGLLIVGLQLGLRSAAIWKKNS